MSDGTTNKSDDDMPLVGYLITVGEILRFEGHEAWAVNISKAASKINEMQDEIEKLQDENKHWSDGHDTLVAEIEKLRAENEKMRTMWDETLLRAIPVAAALKETGDE